MIDKIGNIFSNFRGSKFKVFRGSMPPDSPTMLTSTALVGSLYARASSPNPKNAARSLLYSYNRATYFVLMLQGEDRY